MKVPVAMEKNLETGATSFEYIEITEEQFFMYIKTIYEKIKARTLIDRA